MGLRIETLFSRDGCLLGTPKTRRKRHLAGALLCLAKKQEGKQRGCGEASARGEGRIPADPDPEHPRQQAGEQTEQPSDQTEETEGRAA